MDIPKNINKYLNNYAIDSNWPLTSRSLDNIENVVVIPALAEKNSLFKTLACLAGNPPHELNSTLVLCVINNREKHIAPQEDIVNNQETIELLKHIIRRNSQNFLINSPFKDDLKQIYQSDLRLACLDASSPGLEMPEKNGRVGMARKIGMDWALRIFDYEKSGPQLIFSLDGDTLVEKIYLSSVRNFFEKENKIAGVIAFHHQDAKNLPLQIAICCYEIFLYYYVLGLSYAGSYYAFHSIGSAMVCNAVGYAAVRGMNRREAAEDFYFLDKLAKIQPIGRINSTRVYPSARPSRRTPFGTGQRIIRFMEGKQNEYLLYNPQVFWVLKQWLDLMSPGTKMTFQKISALAKEIHPSLDIFLKAYNFNRIWPRLLANSRTSSSLARQFLYWFDGFKTLKLIRYLTENGLPPVEMFTALKQLLQMMGKDIPPGIDFGKTPGLDIQLNILEYLRNLP